MSEDERKDWGRGLREAAAKQMQLITSNREAYIAAWMAETGLLPSESLLVETVEHIGTTIRTTVEVKRRPGDGGTDWGRVRKKRTP